MNKNEYEDLENQSTKILFSQKVLKIISIFFLCMIIQIVFYQINLPNVEKEEIVHFSFFHLWAHCVLYIYCNVSSEHSII